MYTHIWYTVSYFCSQFGHLLVHLHWKSSWKCRNNREPQIPTEPSCWTSVGIQIYNEDFITHHVDYSRWGWNLGWKAAKVCSGNSAGIANDAHRAYLSCFVASTILVASEHMLIVAVCSWDNLKAACSTVKSCFQTNMHCKVCWMPELVGRKYAYHRNLLVQTCRKMNLFYLHRLKWENACTGNIKWNIKMFDWIKLSGTCTLIRVIQKVFV